MLRNLSKNELAQVSGGSTEEYYPESIYGYELIGWEKEFLGYDTVTWTEEVGFFKTIVHQVDTPVYEINPIYSPIKTVYYY